MNLRFCFDLTKNRTCFYSGDAETECSFTEVVQQIGQLAANLPVISDLEDKAVERIRKGIKEKGLHEAVQTYKEAGYNGAFTAFLLDSIYEYALYHNDEFMRLMLKTVGGYLRDEVQPGFAQLRKLLTAFPAGMMPEMDDFSLFQPVYAEVIDGQIWYTSVFPCNAFLLMFRDVLNMTGTAICDCSVCGELFCGKTGEDCCGDKECVEFHDSADPYLRKKELSAISDTVGIRVRSIRAQLRDICGTEQAVLEFNEFANPLKDALIAKVKLLRGTDASVKEIRRLQREKESLYDRLNEKKREIIAIYDKSY